MIGFKLNQAKTMFFDRPVKNAADRATRKVLSRFGAFVRRSARQSIRKRRRVSKPGDPPSSHTGLLKRFIFFGYEPQSRSVVIGPVALNNKNTAAPEVLEHGGKATIESNSRTSKKQYRAPMAARPFMAPAFAKEKPKLPAMWADSIK